MNRWGADAEQLDRLGEVVGAAARLLDSNRVRLNSQVHHAPWRGHSADRFRQDWDGVYIRDLLSATTFLRDAESRLKQNAEQQRRASAAGAGSGSHQPGTHSPPASRRDFFGFVHNQIARDARDVVLGTVFPLYGAFTQGKDLVGLLKSGEDVVRHPGWSTARRFSDRFERVVDDGLNDVSGGHLGDAFTFGLDAIESKLGQEEIVSTLDNGVAMFYSWKAQGEALLGHSDAAGDAHQMSTYWHQDAYADRQGASYVDDF